MCVGGEVGFISTSEIHDYAILSGEGEEEAIFSICQKKWCQTARFKSDLMPNGAVTQST